MKVPFIDLPREHAAYEATLKRALADVIDSGRYIMGPRLHRLEHLLASYIGARHVIGVSSGTDALLLALYALDIGPGDVVVTTPYSFFSTAGVIPRVGAEVAFVDIDPNTYNMCPDALDAWLATDPRAARAKAILPVHLFGLPADLDGIAALARHRGIAIIEDAAQAIGGRTPDGRHVGVRGKLGCFSFFPTKNLGGFGDGGAVVTDDDILAARVKSLRSYGSTERLMHERIGGNHRLDELQAAALEVQLAYLDDKLHRRAVHAEAYCDAFANLALGLPPMPSPPARHAFHQFVLRVGPARDRLRAQLAEDGVETNVYYPLPLHLQTAFASCGYGVGSLPNAECAARETLAIPIRPSLSLDERQHVVTAVRRRCAPRAAVGGA